MRVEEAVVNDELPLQGPEFPPARGLQRTSRTTGSTRCGR